MQHLGHEEEITPRGLATIIIGLWLVLSGLVVGVLLLVA
jgi:hypothetical protein